MGVIGELRYCAHLGVYTLKQLGCKFEGRTDAPSKLCTLFTARLPRGPLNSIDGGSAGLDVDEFVDDVDALVDEVMLAVGVDGEAVDDVDAALYESVDGLFAALSTSVA